MLKQLLSNHDYTYKMSDDSRVYSKYSPIHKDIMRFNKSEIISTLKELFPETWEENWEWLNL